MMKPLTKQRKAVFDVISASKKHLTASQIFDAAREELPSISFATVYNSLRYLKENRYIGEVAFSNGASKFDRMTERHDHAICEECDSLTDLNIDLPESVISEALTESNFKSARIELTLRGVCADCMA